MTNIKGLFAVGEVDFQYHGANRLGANSLISCLYGGMVCGPKMVAYASSGDIRSLPAAPSSVFESAKTQMKELYDGLGKMDGPENPYKIWWELGQMMTTFVTVVRKNDELKKTDENIQQMMERWNMLLLARVITLGALARDESRGSHYKPDFPDRNDEKFMKTTMAHYDAANNHGTKLTYEEIDAQLVKPVKRDYTGGGAPQAGKAAPAPETPKPTNVATP